MAKRISFSSHLLKRERDQFAHLKAQTKEKCQKKEGEAGIVEGLSSNASRPPTRVDASLLTEEGLTEFCLGLVVLRRVYDQRGDGNERNAWIAYANSAFAPLLESGDGADADRIRIAYSLSTRQIDPILDLTVINTTKKPVVLTSVSVKINFTVPAYSGFATGPLLPCDVVTLHLRPQDKEVSVPFTRPIHIAPDEPALVHLRILSEVLCGYYCDIVVCSDATIIASLPGIFLTFLDIDPKLQAAATS